MTTKEDLWHVLNDLTNEQFKNFKWFLKEAEEGFSAIPAVRLEAADQQETVDQMVQNYGTITKALQKTIKILEKIHRNDLAQCLSRQKNVKNINNSARSPCDSERQKAKLEAMKTKTELMIQERKKKIDEVQRSAELSRKSADQQILDSERAFSALIQSAQRSLVRVEEEIKERQRRTQREADRIIQELKQELSELSKRQAELDDNLDYNQSFSFKNWTDVTVPQPSYEETVTTSVNAVKETLAEETRTLLRRAELNRIKQFMVDVTLDQNTAHPSLVLTKDKKQVYCGNTNQNLPDNPERFDTAPNVLGKQSFSSGMFYFEVQVKGKISWDVGVVHESISRKGSINARPDDGYWAICLRRGQKYKASGVRLTLLSPLNRLGVFVDCEKGLISFYNVDSAEIIHKFTDLLFKEKLYPFFSPSINHGGLNIVPLVL